MTFVSLERIALALADGHLARLARKVITCEAYGPRSSASETRIAQPRET